ncbi:hypothetical protein E4T72_12895 [Staphylococcus xylosus]|uniref:hypothetical protein n=1 Tax=Staphylococcus xylosus TaxID=1288 RepID=UPI001072BAA0|nr:hypothetical protein [Staphylococcus xylosus]MBF0811956.1 hypothetical protein [Staphylococcus xylosus]TFV19951.1 hypothetical protein E4T72_12895 [Staphylococcus xylosus]HDD0732934.1 hypothetical protein [Staphylococcus aureus]
MSEYKDDELDRINREIEDELSSYDPSNESHKNKKQFLTLSFFCTLVLVIIMAVGIVRMFI